MKREYWCLLIGIGIGLVAAPQLRKLPIVDKLPTV